MASGGSILGNAVRRVEDPGILTGATRYTDDLVVEGALHLVFVRSTVAHARIDAIAVDEAKAMPGVVDVVTAADLALPLHHGMPLIDPKFNRPPLADGVVRFVGEPVVAVVAETAAQAVDAAEAVIVDYDDLDVVVDPEAALAPGAPVLFPEAGTNVCNDLPSGRDADVHADADLVVEGRFVNQRVAAAPLEVNGCIAAPDPDSGGVVVWLPSQGPHGMQHQLAAALGLERDQVRVVSPAVGGGFGAKQGVCVEFLVVARAHQRLGRPVRWVETRSENMVAMRQGRAQVQQLRLGVKRDGTFTSLSGTIYQDAGAYPEVGAFLPFFTRNMASGVYVIPEIAIDIKSVVTNTTPVGAYRGAGRPEATSMVERIVDLAAAELGMDPAEIRRRNLVAPDAFPYTTATGATYDVGDYGRALDEALRLADYDGLRREQQERRDRDAAPWLGIGLSAYVEVTGPISLTDEWAEVSVERDGSATVRVGTSSHGQGHATSFAMLVQEMLGIPVERVRFVQSDTAEVPQGKGTGGSRSLQIGGSAVWRSAEAVLDRAKRLAAHLLEADADDVVVHDDGRVGVAGVPASALTWTELAAAAADDARRPDDLEPGLAAAVEFEQGSSSFPFGAHVSVVEVDPETGAVTLLRHVAVDDCGRVLNPLIVRGQQHGGIAQGVAQALYEQVRYDEWGTPLTGNFMDYAFPSAAELPGFVTANTETPTPLNPLGAKGIGESGTIGSTPAVQNAVVDALSHVGIRHLDMPLTASRVWQAIADHGAPAR